ncbi:MAG TPA: RAMP superfamily CRISPR-associated protein [Nitrospiraceae bacterium]|nr:RAMP superfamily CRISPR-associated protein [Nitrospiraceae bacterium]
MSYDLYVELSGNSQDDVKSLVTGNHRELEVQDIAERIRLLTGVAAQNPSTRDYAVAGDQKQGGGYKSLVHSKSGSKGTPYAKELIASEWKRLEHLGLLRPSPNLINTMPLGSWFLQFTFTLAKPWMSKDDAPFYVAESVNPVRKDKVFKVPTMSAASWKGLLRWTAMHVRLALKKDEPSDEDFAAERFRQTLLFGDEKGEEPGQTKDFAAYLDGSKPSARELYVRKVKEYFLGDANAKDMPHHSGRLSFYPTFFDLIDVEVINPHSRGTKAGTHPIYLECVPAGAKGTFSLLYVPFDLIGKPENEVKAQAKEDLLRVAEAVSAMMLTYGFSAKRTSGYGTARDEIENGVVRTRARPQGWPLTRLGKLASEVKDVRV